jgi:anti-sigma B factor antagonist
MPTQRFFLRGEIDIASAPTLQCELERYVHDSEGALLLDCCELSFIDSSGVAALVKAQRVLAEEGRELRVVNADAMTTRVFDVLGLTEAFHVNETPTVSAT